MTIEYRQRSRQAETYRALIAVGRRSETGCAAAENLGARGELNVDFQADDGFVLGNQLRRGQRFHAGGHIEIIKGEPLGARYWPRNFSIFCSVPSAYCRLLRAPSTSPF